jgi:hypothetical protein
MILRANHPYDHITSAVRGGNERRAASIPVHTPSINDGRRIGCSNAESQELEPPSATSNIRALVSSVSDGCLHYILIGNMEGSYRLSDAAQVVPINQVCVAIFAQCNHESGWCCAGNVHEQWTGTAQIQVAIVELLPIGWYPVIAARSSKDRARLKTYHRFTATPVSSRVPRVSGGNERSDAFTGHAADSPYRAALGAGSPCHYCAGWIWIIYRHSHQPATIVAAIPHAAISDINNVIRDAERRSLLLDLSSEVHPVVLSRRLHVNGPP